MTSLRLGILALLAVAGCDEEAASRGPCAAFTDDERAAVESLLLPEALPPSPGNADADDEAAARLGFKIFFARGFASDPSLRCASCHQPELSFRDRGSVSTGVGRGTRNAPSIFNAARMKVFTWDGRADSLWSQPLFAIEEP